MAAKNILGPYKLVTAGSLGANLTSNPVNIKLVDNVAVELIWTGTPVGTFSVQGSLDFVPADNNDSVIANSGNWVAITLSPAPTAAGTADVALLNLQQLCFPWIRIVYTRTSGTGALDAYISAKGI